MEQRGVQRDDWVPSVERKLRSLFGDNENVGNEAGAQAVLDRLKELLIRCNALIAGGCILNAIQPFPGDPQTDIDIYVPTAKIPEFIQGLCKDDILNTTRFRAIEASHYCKSFLRKNGIRKIYTFNSRFEFDGSIINVDVMSVRNKRKPLDVVNNFDLTFCQVWYDGAHVFASHPEHIEEKKGLMNSEYIPTFLAGNRFLVKRIRKYIDRGFTILPQEDGLPSLTDIFNGMKSEMKSLQSCRSEIPADHYSRWINYILLKIAKYPLHKRRNIVSIYPSERIDPL